MRKIMYFKTILLGLLSWFIGLTIDMNWRISSAELGVACLRVVLPMIVMSILILKAIHEQDKKQK